MLACVEAHFTLLLTLLPIFSAVKHARLKGYLRIYNLVNSLVVRMDVLFIQPIMCYEEMIGGSVTHLAHYGSYVVLN